LVVLSGHHADALIGQSLYAYVTFLPAVFGDRGEHQSFASPPHEQHSLEKADPMAESFEFFDLVCGVLNSLFERQEVTTGVDIRPFFGRNSPKPRSPMRNPDYEPGVFQLFGSLIQRQGRCLCCRADADGRSHWTLEVASAIPSR
jgi:hypothetical protein